MQTITLNQPTPACVHLTGGGKLTGRAESVTFLDKPHLQVVDVLGERRAILSPQDYRRIEVLSEETLACLVEKATEERRKAQAKQEAEAKRKADEESRRPLREAIYTFIKPRNGVNLHMILVSVTVPGFSESMMVRELGLMVKDNLTERRIVDEEVRYHATSANVAW